MPPVSIGMAQTTTVSNQRTNKTMTRKKRTFIDLIPAEELGTNEEEECAEIASNRNPNPSGGDLGTNGTDEHICPCYYEEKERWSDTLEQLDCRTPKCGHAISWLGEFTGGRYEISTASVYGSAACIYVDFLHNIGKTVTEAEFKDVDRYLLYRTRSGRSKSTLSSDISAIIQLYTYIDVYRDSTTANVKLSKIREGIKAKNYNSRPSFERESLEKEELKKLLKATDNKRNYLIITVGTVLGPRNKDLRKIKVTDVDLENEEIKLRNTKSGGYYTRPLTDDLTVAFRYWIHEERPNIVSDDENEYLFPNGKGGHLGEQQINRIINNAAEKAGIQEILTKIPLHEAQRKLTNTDKKFREIKKVTAHTLRHTCRDLLKDAGVSLEGQREALDHNDVNTTRSYGKREEHKDEVRDKFSGIDVLKSDDEENMDGIDR